MGAFQLGTGVVITEHVTVLGVLTDPTTVVFNVRLPDNSVDIYTLGIDAEVSHPSVGTFVLTLDPLQVALQGNYHYDCVGTGAVEITSGGDFSMIPPGTSEVAPPKPVNGPCQPWCDASDVAVYAGDTGSIDLTKYAYEASALLYELSARQYSGTCVRKVRPCSQGWCGWWGSGYWQSAEGQNFWTGTAWGWGGGYNEHWGSTTSQCGCNHLCEVRLSGYPVWSIVEVKIDGAVVAPATYRLDGWENLVRVRLLSTDPQLCWPTCQNLDLPDTQDGTFSVSYLCGVDPPLLGKDAAAQLAAQFYFAATGAACALPVGTTKLVRQGVTIERALFASWAQNADGQWATGLPIVDAFLAGYNKNGLRRRGAVWSPDVQPYARKLGSIPGGS